RDGTINEDYGDVYKIKDLRIIPKVVEGLEVLQEAGYKLIIITNQSGIGRGYYTEEDYHDFQLNLRQKLNKQGIFITGEYFCPHNLDDNCNCRKPKTGMLEQAANDFHLDLNKCWMIGDSASDIQTGKNAGCKTIHVLTGKDYKEPIKKAEFIANNLVEAANYILSQNK
ncbi:HAD family hydrolase, partial [Candidatus Pacearchaeota archaeon]|nr:HAD family hydrolase [Candidatus Pacearchaeota archaeon]